MLKLDGFAQSGNTFKVAFPLRALGVPWPPVAMSFAPFAGGATRDPAWREGVNAMGEVPVLEFPNHAAWRDRLKASPGWGDSYEVLPRERITP